MAQQQLRPGQTVRIQCTVKPGPIPGEFMVSIQMDQELISGFVKSQYLRTEPSPSIVARILEVSASEVKVNLPGSFFNTAGLASVSPGWATTHLDVAA